jgi:hypothetical protein
MTQAHKVAWWVHTDEGKIRHTAEMRGAWGYDVTCSCGWNTNTGGATLTYMRREVSMHKLLAD